MEEFVISLSYPQIVRYPAPHIALMRRSVLKAHTMAPAPTSAKIQSGIKVWHGTRCDLSSLNVAPAIRRDGWAQNGPGLYFTTCKADALSYALPEGFIWECVLDPDVPGTTVVELGSTNSSSTGRTDLRDGLRHFVVSQDAAFEMRHVTRIEQYPARKLCHRERVAVLIDPECYGVRFTGTRRLPLTDLKVP